MRKGVFIFFLFPAFLWAQDIHFTQWMHNALFSNPAQSGFFEGLIEFMLNNVRSGPVLVGPIQLLL